MEGWKHSLYYLHHLGWQRLKMRVSVWKPWVIQCIPRNSKTKPPLEQVRDRQANRCMSISKICQPSIERQIFRKGFETPDHLWYFNHRIEWWEVPWCQSNNTYERPMAKRLKLFGITYFVGKIKFKLLFQGPLAKWDKVSLDFQHQWWTEMSWLC